MRRIDLTSYLLCSYCMLLCKKAHSSHLIAFNIFLHNVTLKQIVSNRIKDKEWKLFDRRVSHRRNCCFTLGNITFVVHSLFTRNPHLGKIMFKNRFLHVCLWVCLCLLLSHICRGCSVMVVVVLVIVSDMCTLSCPHASTQKPFECLTVCWYWVYDSWWKIFVESLFIDESWWKNNMSKLLSLKFSKFCIKKEKYNIFID